MPDQVWIRCPLSPQAVIPGLIADTGYELYAACETMWDLDELYLELGVHEEASGDAMHSACNPDLPDAGEVWDGVLAKSGEWLDEAREAPLSGPDG